jgi:hypothetical protein
MGNAKYDYSQEVIQIEPEPATNEEMNFAGVQVRNNTLET